MANIIPWDTRNEIKKIRTEIDKIFENLYSRNLLTDSTNRGDWVPTIDVLDTGQEIVVHAELPGIDPKNIELSLNGRILTIKGEKKDKHKEKDKIYHRIECSYGSFSRSFELPVGIDVKGVVAIYKNGILTLNMPKSKKSTAKKIEVTKI